MSKTISDQILKAQTLTEGLRKNVELVKNKGLDETFISQVEADSKELAACDHELDKFRDELHARVKSVNEKLANLKAEFQKARTTVRNNFDQTEWANFGVMDKR